MWTNTKISTEHTYSVVMFAKKKIKTEKNDLWRIDLCYLSLLDVFRTDTVANRFKLECLQELNKQPIKINQKLHVILKTFEKCWISIGNHKCKEIL